MNDKSGDCLTSDTPFSFLWTPTLPSTEEPYENHCDSRGYCSHASTTVNSVDPCQGFCFIGSEEPEDTQESPISKNETFYGKRRRLESSDTQSDGSHIYDSLLSPTASPLPESPPGLAIFPLKKTNCSDYEVCNEKTVLKAKYPRTEVLSHPCSWSRSSENIRRSAGRTPEHAVQDSLQLVFLPAEGQNLESGKKYNRVAELIKLDDGSLKLFVERGRILETQISYNASTTIPSDQSEDCRHLKDFKLRFRPFNRCGSIMTPVLGFRGPLQKKAYTMPEQLCFIQLLTDTEQESPCYITDSSGFLCMEVPMLRHCHLYQLVFPFLNSQCPTAYRKDVWIRVSVIDGKKKELCHNEFQVVCCTSPVRDCKRQINRFPSTVQRASTAKQDMVPADWVSERSNRSVSSSGNETDVSPVSADFLNSCSPINEDVPLQSLSAFIPSGVSKQTSIQARLVQEACHQRVVSDRPCLPRLQSTHTSASINQMAGSIETHTEEHGMHGGWRTFRQDQNEVSMTSHNRGVRALEPNNEPSEKEKYVITTTNRRIYQILLNLERELSEAFEQNASQTSRGVLFK